MQAEIPLPVMFNPYKHHFHFLLNEIKRWKQCEWAEISKELLPIGNNLVDFYTGTLSIHEICTETLYFFRNQKIVLRDDFIKWLQTSEWKKIELSDHSKWLIKCGNDDERFIHVHPAKFSMHSVRVRATTLKTVIALMVCEITISPVHKNNLLAVNTIRKEKLELSPIKSLHNADSGIMRLWQQFEDAFRAG